MRASTRGQTPKLQQPSQEVTTSPQMLLVASRRAPAASGLVAKGNRYLS